MKYFIFSVILMSWAGAALADTSSTTVETPVSNTSQTEAPSSEEKPASPYGSVSGSLAGTTDYIYRGQSLTDHKPAAQGEIDWTQPLGFYAGAWGSNVKIPGSVTPVELDWYGGYNYTINSAWGAGLGVMYYSYVRDGSINTLEYPFTLSWTDFKAGVAYSPHWGGGDAGDECYFSMGWSHKVKWETTLALNVGYSDFAQDLGMTNYFDFHAGLSREFVGLNWDASGYFVNHEQMNGLDDPRAVLTVTKNL